MSIVLRNLRKAINGMRRTGTVTKRIQVAVLVGVVAQLWEFDRLVSNCSSCICCTGGCNFEHPSKFTRASLVPSCTPLILSSCHPSPSPSRLIHGRTARVRAHFHLFISHTSFDCHRTQHIFLHLPHAQDPKLKLMETWGCHRPCTISWFSHEKIVHFLGPAVPQRV